MVVTNETEHEIPSASIQIYPEITIPVSVVLRSEVTVHRSYISQTRHQNSVYFFS